MIPLPTLIMQIILQSNGGCNWSTGSETFPTEGNFWFQAHWEPCASCCNKHRIGVTSDGGKWVCMDRFPRTGIAISVGSNNDFSFERALIDEYGVTAVHTYDHTSFPPLPHESKNITFFKEEVTYAMFPRLVARLRHKPISLFKIDCEGCEYELFNNGIILRELATRGAQILIEIHFKSAKEVSTLWNKFEKAGYRVFSKEPNIAFTDGSCVELSLIPNKQ